MIRFHLEDGSVVDAPEHVAKIFQGVSRIVVELGHADANTSMIDGKGRRAVRAPGSAAVEFVEFDVRGLRLEHLPIDDPEAEEGELAGEKTLPIVEFLMPLEFANKVGEGLAEKKNAGLWTPGS